NVEMVRLPPEQTRTEHYEIGVLKRSANPTAALRFARYVTAADAGLKPIAAHHFDVVTNADAWAEMPTIHLHAGAMLQPGLRKVIEAFQVREGVQINTTYDGCGLLIDNMNILAKQESKLFPDGFVSCDLSFTKKVSSFFESVKDAERAYDVILQNDLVL